MNDVTFRSKVDWWFGVAIGAAAVASLAALVAVAIDGTRKDALLVVPLILLCVAFPIWLLRSTYYRIESTQLYIKSGPFVWRVPLNEIKAVKPTRNPLSSPALSLDRLRIDCRTRRSVMISPADKAGFIAALKKRIPSLES